MDTEVSPGREGGEEVWRCEPCDSDKNAKRGMPRELRKMYGEKCRDVGELPYDVGKRWDIQEKLLCESVVEVCPKR